MNLAVSHLERLFGAEPADKARSRLGQQPAAEVDEPRAVARNHPLMPRRAQRINPHAPDINLESASRLAGVDDEYVIFLNAPQLFHVDSEAVRELNVAEADNACLAGNRALDIFGVNLAAGRLNEVDARAAMEPGDRG